MKLKAKRSITLIIVAVLLLAVGLGVLSVSHNAKSMKQFVADGFILDAPAEIAVTEVNQQHYFSQGSKYQEKFDTKVLFKDANGEEVSIDINQFLHYADGSLGSFTKGVIMNLDDVGEEQFGYYSLTPNTLLLKNGTSYEMSSRGEKMTISEFVWKISDTDYMIVSPEVTLKLSASQEITLPGYAQIKYVDSGIVRIVHQQGTYQTVSADSFLYTEGGAELNLVGKNFYQNGEPGLSLDSMALDDEDYIELDENADSPELKIPTFNVINGKDGASGNAGEAGEAGEIGEDGEDGEEGEQGVEGEEGVAGEEGMAGSEGNQGEDGVEGDEGIMGYDGAEGLDGEDAQNGDDPIVAVDLLSRPTVSVDTANGYDVTSSSAQMQFDMLDLDGSLVGNGTTTVEVYDRATMNRVNSANDAANLGAQLEQTGKLNFTQTGLNPDTEYVVVVKGQYVVAEGVDPMDATLYTKIFKTDALGIVLSKGVVTEESVSAVSKVTATNVSSYIVHFYNYDENGNKVSLARYNYDGTTGTQTSVFDNTVPNFDSGNRPAGENYKLTSNTRYYAEIASVLDTNGEMVNAGDTETELMTLKKKPYHKVKDENGNELDPEPVTAMVPEVVINNTAHTITVSLDSVEDDDNGITGYRYELYNATDFENAKQDQTLADLQPAFTKSVAVLADQTFTMPDGDANQYIARVVVEFNDNEKDVEYSTAFSTPTGLSASASNLIVEFVDIATYPEAIAGKIRIIDPEGKSLYDYINGSRPLELSILGEYNDIISVKLTDKVGTQVNTVEDEAGNEIRRTTLKFDSQNGNTYLYSFEQTGLHKKATYSLSLSGPWDTNGDLDATGAEVKTFLTGARATTTDTQSLSMAFRSYNKATVAFAQEFYLTNPALTGAEGEPDEAFYEYEAGILDEVRFELIHVLDNGLEQKMGNDAVVQDVQFEEYTHDSVFYRSCWVDRTDANITDSEYKDTHGGLVVKDSVGAHQLVLTPESFGLDNNDSRFFSGGVFKIRAIEGKDYTEHKDNTISFVNKEDVAVFTITKRHVQAVDPNTQVSASVITNAGAREDYDEDDKADDTIVGVRFQAEYPYTDVVKATYYIYEMGEDETGSYLGQKFYDDGVETEHPGELVLVGTHVIGQSGQYHTPEVELYFKGTESYVENGTVVNWTNADGTPVNGTVLERGKRYYIRYEVEADNSMINCDGNNENDNYPDCSYDGEDPVPFYRSPIIEFRKQTPKVLRYPYTSDNDSATWMYRVVDPDDAVENGFMVKVGGTAQEATDAAPATLTADVNNYLSDYHELDVTGLSDGKYYAVSLNYKLSSTAEVQSITSAPVQFKSAVTSAPAGISAKGLKKNGIPTENVSAGEAGREKAIINEGGYRYKLTLQGADVKKYAAYRVTFTGTNDESNKVVYDPVYPSYINAISDGGDYAEIYLDAAPVQTLVDAGEAEVTVRVDGYYSTFVSGVEGYKSTGISDPSLGDENLFALKMYQEDGSTYYRRLEETGWIPSMDTVRGSLILPGENTGDNGFEFSDDAKESAVMTMRYPTTPLTLANGMEDFAFDLAMNETGMRVTSMANTAYYTVEKLGMKEEIPFFSTDATLVIGDILPAVREVENVPGATSAYLRFETTGTGASDTSKIYAKVYDANGNLFKLTQGTDGTGENAVTYYTVDGAGTIDDYAYTPFNAKNIPLHTSGGKIYADLRIRGLSTGTEYKVVLFAYNSNEEIVNLYSFDGNRAGWEYKIKTLEQIKLDVVGPSYFYTSYNNKGVTFNFGIPGDEGTNKQISFVVNDKNGTKVAEGEVDPLGVGSGYEYYSQSPAQNNPITVKMNPTGGLRLGTEYTLIVKATSKGDGSSLGSKEVDFTTPASLKDPTFNITATSRKHDDPSSNLVTISATIASTDSQRSIMEDTYTVALVDKAANAVKETVDITRSASTSHSKTVTFADVEGGKEYIIRVIANIDNTNDNVRDKEIEQEYTVVALGNTTAQIGPAANLSQLYINFTNLQSFDTVTEIVITVNNPSDGSQIFRDSFTVTDEMKNEGSFDYRNEWTVSEAGNYSLTVQYRDEQDVALGNDKATVVVQDTGTGVSDGGEQTGYSLRMMSRRPQTSEEVTDETLTENNTTSKDASSGTESEDNTNSETSKNEENNSENSDNSGVSGSSGNSEGSKDSNSSKDSEGSKDPDSSDNSGDSDESDDSGDSDESDDSGDSDESDDSDDSEGSGSEEGSDNSTN